MAPADYTVEVGVRLKGDPPDRWLFLGPGSPSSPSASSPWRYPTREAFERALPHVARALAHGVFGGPFHRTGAVVYTVTESHALMARTFPGLHLEEAGGGAAVEEVRLHVVCGPDTPEARLQAT